MLIHKGTTKSKTEDLSHSVMYNVWKDNVMRIIIILRRKLMTVIRIVLYVVEQLNIIILCDPNVVEVIFFLS